MDRIAILSELKKVLAPYTEDKAMLEGINEQTDLIKDLKSFKDLREFLIVSKVEVEMGPYEILAAKAPGEKCVRCWVYSTEISQEPKTLGVCPKCVEALT